MKKNGLDRAVDDLKSWTKHRKMKNEAMEREADNLDCMAVNLRKLNRKGRK